MAYLCDPNKVKYAHRRYKQEMYRMSKSWMCTCGSNACKSTLNQILRSSRHQPFDAAVRTILGAEVPQSVAPSAPRRVIVTAPQPQPTDPRPKLANFPPQWEAARAVSKDKWEEVEPYLHCLVAIWAKTGARALRREFKVHDMTGHVIGGAFVGVTGEHLAMVAETMLTRNLGPYEGVRAALAISREDNPAAGNLLPAYTLQRGQTTIRELIEFAESVEVWRARMPVKELLAAAAVL